MTIRYSSHYYETPTYTHIYHSTGEDNNGRPSISTSHCSASISNVDFKFHGGMSWLNNLFSGKVGNLIKNTLRDQVQ